MIKNNIPLQYNSFVELFSIPEIAHSFKTDLGIGIFMSFLGFLGLFLQLKGDAKSVMPTIKKE